MIHSRVNLEHDTLYFKLSVVLLTKM